MPKRDLNTFNPFNPWSDQHLISPNSNTENKGNDCQPWKL